MQRRILRAGAALRKLERFDELVSRYRERHNPGVADLNASEREEVAEVADLLAKVAEGIGVDAEPFDDVASHWYACTDPAVRVSIQRLHTKLVVAVDNDPVEDSEAIEAASRLQLEISQSALASDLDELRSWADTSQAWVLIESVLPWLTRLGVDIRPIWDWHQAAYRICIEGQEIDSIDDVVKLADSTLICWRQAPDVRPAYAGATRAGANPHEANETQTGLGPIPAEFRSIAWTKKEAARLHNNGTMVKNGPDYFRQRPSITIEGGGRQWFFDVRQFPERFREKMMGREK